MAQPEVGFDFTGGHTALEGIYFRGSGTDTPERRRGGRVVERGNVAQ